MFEIHKLFVIITKDGRIANAAPTRTLAEARNVKKARDKRGDRIVSFVPWLKLRRAKTTAVEPEPTKAKPTKAKPAKRKPTKAKPAKRKPTKEQLEMSEAQKAV